VKRSIGARLTVALLLAGALAGCATLSPSPPVATPDSIAPSEPAFSDEELATWREFRTLWGLAADDPWMVQVASMPGSAHNDFEIPLTAREIDHIGQQITGSDAWITFARGYGARHRDAFAGVIMDGPTVVLLMKAPIEPFVADIAKLVPAGAPIKVRAVPFSLPELQTKADAILTDAKWFTDHKLELVDVEPGAGNVQLRYRGGNGKEADVIAGRYGRPDWLELSWWGPAPWTGARGTVVVTAKDRDGHRVADAYCVVDPVDPLITYEPGVALVTNTRGVCRLPAVPAVDVRVMVWWQEQPYTGDPAGSGRVTVPPNGKAPVTVVLAPWP